MRLLLWFPFMLAAAAFTGYLAPQEVASNGLTGLLAYGAAIGASVVLDWTKKQTGWADRRWGRLVKPVQPVLVLAASFGLPYLASLLGVVDPVDPTTFIHAPVATLVSVTARELLRRKRPPR